MKLARRERLLREMNSGLGRIEWNARDLFTTTCQRANDETRKPGNGKSGILVRFWRWDWDWELLDKVIEYCEGGSEWEVFHEEEPALHLKWFSGISVEVSSCSWVL